MHGLPGAFTKNTGDNACVQDYRQARRKERPKVRPKASPPTQA